jgi:DNA-directed RNA polymerase subunit K/omega
MEAKKNRPVNTTITRDTSMFSEGTNNIYETVAVLAKRANQIANDMKRELHKKIDEFTPDVDTADEMTVNRDQIDIVRHYEQMPKPTLQATQEYLNGEIYYRNPAKEDQNMQRLEAMENDAVAAENANAKQ